MWKPEHRRAADRTGLRYPSDLSDAEADCRLSIPSFGDPYPSRFLRGRLKIQPRMLSGCLMVCQVGQRGSFALYFIGAVAIVAPP
jgi:hypothetical protein